MTAFFAPVFINRHNRYPPISLSGICCILFLEQKIKKRFHDLFLTSMLITNMKEIKAILMGYLQGN